MTDTPFATDDYQAKVLAYMLHHPDFAQVAKEYLSPELFNNKVLQWFYNTISGSEVPLNPVLLKEELIQAANHKAIKEDEIPKFLQVFQVTTARCTPAEEEYIRGKLGSFVKAQSVKNTMIHSVLDLIKNEQWDDVVSQVQEALTVGVDLEDLGYDYFEHVEERIAERASVKPNLKIYTGIPDLDDLTYGGLNPGQVGMVAGGTGRGKSIFLQWLARTAVQGGKNVVYLTLELSKDQISERFDSMWTKVSPRELNDYQQEVLKEVQAVSHGGKLTIKHYPADSCSVNTLRAFLNKLAHTGIVPDMVIVDYLDLMKSHRNYNDVHAETDAVTKGLVGLAAEQGVVLWTATQLNRAGMVAETPDEAGMAGYIGKQYHVDLVIFMAQTADERQQEIMRLQVTKNRNGPPGVLPVGTNYARMVFYDRPVQTQTEEEDTIDDNQGSNTASNMQVLRRAAQSEPPDGDQDG